MIKNIELLAPGGDIDSIKAAIVAGADAVYCGLDKFNARNRATNISFDNLNGILHLAHEHNCRVYLTLNIVFVDSEIPALFSLLNKLVNTNIDGIIVQDLGLLYLLSTYFKSLIIHASTQLTTHNKGQIKFLNRLNAMRINLSRELNIHEIKALTAVAHQNKISVEVFVHGSYCISFSGLCYLSSFQSGNSGNRGRCSQPCRDEYKTTQAGKNFPLNMKDNSAYLDLLELADAGVDSLKIEGRIKKAQYVYTIVNAWRKQLQNFYNQNRLDANYNILYKAFNRDFSNGFLKGEITKEMFIDNPRDHSAIYLSEKNGRTTDEKLEKAKGDIYDERLKMATDVEERIKHLSIAKTPLILTISGECGTPLKVSVTTNGSSFDVISECKLTNSGIEKLNYETIFKKLKSINDTEFEIEDLELSNLQTDVYLPFKELNAIKKRVMFILNGSKETVAPVAVPVLKKRNREKPKMSILVLISSLQDLHLCKETSVTICFQLPDCLKSRSSEFIKLFTENRELIPWFPSILFGEDYLAAVDILHQIKPACIVTNNTGIAYEAFQRGIAWIAGPCLNITNSFSLVCLKENFNCKGAYISNEINKTQIKNINKPADFELYYSIYHPNLLMTSRQCLFHQVTGCEKSKMYDNCIPQCERSATITNLKDETFRIEKSKENHHHC